MDFRLTRPIIEIRDFLKSQTPVMKILLFLSFLVVLAACNPGQNDPPLVKTANASINIEVFRISDIDFPQQQYSINFWLSIDYNGSVIDGKKVDFVNQLRIPEAKGTPRIRLIDTTAGPKKN